MKKLSILLFSVITAFTLVACANEVQAAEGYYVSIDINPSIEFIVSEDDIVESFIFLNEDAAILCADLDFTGMHIDDALELFVETATAAGYIDPEGDDNAVLITVLGDPNQEEQMTRVRERIQERLNRHFAKRFINALVITEEFTQEDLVLQAEELGVSPGKLKLALASQLGDETLVLDDLLDMPVKDILALVRENHQDAFNEFKTEHQEEYRQRLQERLDQYQARYDQFRENHPEMTDEEVEQAMRQIRQRIRRETREQWEQRQEEWRQTQEDNCTEECNNV